MNSAFKPVDQRIDEIADIVMLAYEDPDPWIRTFFEPYVMPKKWERAALLQGWF